MKKIIIGVAVGIILLLGLIVIFNLRSSNQTIKPEQEQLVLEKTLKISQEYIVLRYQTDNVLVNAEAYANYDTWNEEISALLIAWNDLAEDAASLEREAAVMADEKISWHLIETARAYDRQEISNIFDRAPAGKKIATLAKHLGVDAKMAFKILQQDQAQVEADAWNEAGDTFQTLESSAVIIKDTCKVTGFVGGLVVTGGAAGLASASTLTQAAVLVSGADLTLEVTSDAARIGLGNNNKISTVVDSARIVTEPLSSILTISSIPGNIGSGFEKFSAVMVGLEQFNSAASEGKIVGVQLPVYKPDNKTAAVKIAVLNKPDLELWLEEQGAKNETENIQEFMEALKEKIAALPTETDKVNIEKKEEGSDDKNQEVSQNKNGASGLWEGTVTWTAAANESPQTIEVVIKLNDDGTVTTVTGDWSTSAWTQEGDVIRFYGEDKADGYNEFTISGDTMVFVKMAGPDQADRTQWVEVLAGEDFFGGKFMEIIFERSLAI